MTRSTDIRFGFFGHTEGEDDEFDRVAEQVNVDVLAWGESPTQMVDPYLGMALAASATTRPMLGTVMTCPGLRHPAVLANTFRDLQRISDGRAFCGIGSGDLALVEMGERPYRLDRFVEYATAVRDLIHGDETTWNGHQVRMKRPPVAQPVPVWLGADGPRGIRAAAQVADGVIVGQAGAPEAITTVIKRATAGAEEVSRSVDDLDIWFMLRAVVTDTEDGAIEIDGLDEYAARGLRYLWRTAGRPERPDVSAAVLKRRGVTLSPDIADRLYEFNDRFDAGAAFGSKANVRLMHDVGLTEFAARYFYISGPPDYVAAGIRKLVDAGARNFLTPFMAGDRIAGARQIGAIFETLL